MKQTTIPVKPESKINVKASEDLSIEGTQEKYLTAIVEHGESLKIIEGNGVMDFKATTDCRLLIPETMSVTVEKVGGDASVKNLLARVIIGKVGGDLTLQSVSGASIEMVGGDITFRGTTGAVEIARVGGDLHGEGIFSLTSGTVGGDATLLDVEGRIDLDAGGDVELSFTRGELPQLTIRAGGDIKLIVPTDAQAQLELHSGGEEISIHACGQDADWEDAELSLPLGNGGALVRLDAGGDILVSDHEQTTRDFTDVFDDLEDNWKDFGIELEERIRESLGLASETLARASLTANQAAEKARAKVDQAMHKLEEKGVDFDQKQRWVGFSFDGPRATAEKPKSGPTDEERMLVLKMLQEQKITVEEAEKLLNALDR